MKTRLLSKEKKEVLVICAGILSFSLLIAILVVMVLNG